MATSAAWAGPPAETPAAPPAGKKVPIIDVVAVKPAQDDTARFYPTPPANSPDLRLDPGLVQALNLNRKPEDGQGKSSLGLQAGPANAQLQTFGDSGLDRRLEGLRMPNSSLSYKHDGLLDDADQQGGFLALRWKASASSEITLGGGYSRSYAASGSGGPGSQTAVRGGGALTSNKSESGFASTESSGRWGAFLAVPYQLGKNMGVRPEVSYYRGDQSDASRDTANEWVMGLRFTFGF